MSTLLALPERLTVREAREVSVSLASRIAAAAGTPVVIDAAPLQHFDSSALAVLLAARRASVAAGVPCAIEGWPPKLADLAELYGVGEVLNAGTTGIEPVAPAA